MSNKTWFFKISIVAVISLICIAVLALAIFMKTLFPAPISKSNMENEFVSNKNMITNITNYLVSQEYPDIYITSNYVKGKMSVSNNSNETSKMVNIPSDSIAENIDTLFYKHKYEVITKKDNYIYFQRWSNRDYGRGIVYSINGIPPENDLIIKIEPLNEKNWYFYEEK
jgi:hypothetical protein